MIFFTALKGHSYFGAFGAHTSMVIRRLRRLCRHYGSDPVFIVASATIANPQHHAQALIGVPHVALVQEDGAPHGSRTYVFWNPPLHQKASLVERAAQIGKRMKHDVSAEKLATEISKARQRSKLPAAVTTPAASAVASSDVAASLQILSVPTSAAGNDKERSSGIAVSTNMQEAAAQPSNKQQQRQQRALAAELRHAQQLLSGVQVLGNRSALAPRCPPTAVERPPDAWFITSGGTLSMTQSEAAKRPRHQRGGPAAAVDGGEEGEEARLRRLRRESLQYLPAIGATEADEAQRGERAEARRRSPVTEISLLLCECIQHGLRTIAFCKTRMLCELVAAYTRELIKVSAPQLAGAFMVGGRLRRGGIWLLRA